MRVETRKSAEVAIALRRFGLGARPGDVSLFRGDPRAAVTAQLEPTSARLEDPDLPTTADVLRRYFIYNAEIRKPREPAAPPAAPAMASAPEAAMTPAADAAKRRVEAPPLGPAPTPADPPLPERLHRAEFEARLGRQLTTSTPMVERLVNFWSNHFCIANRKTQMLKAVAGAYEREVIRPHVLGRFSDMLSASTHHPAMLDYLDNHVSVGPTSKAGLRSKRGLNENLGREILELHTLGVDGGYTQADVTALSTALTGWGYADLNVKAGEPGTFHFAPERHEPGLVRLLGKDYREGGIEQATTALEDLARHPATARHVARKLVRHFVGDAAPPELIDRLAAVFRDTDGDLRAVTLALVSAEEAWQAPPVKVLPPWDFLVATGRLLGIDWRYAEAGRMLALFGQPLWNVPFPAGWPDDDEAWAAPASLLELLDAVAALAKRNAGDRNVLRLAEEAFGAPLHPQTQRAVARAETPEIALTLFLMSPDFLRR